MKLEEAQKKLSVGHLGFIAEYRGSKAETIAYTDKTSGRAASMKTLRHNIEMPNGEGIAFGERVPDTFDPNLYQTPYKKGQKVFVTLTSLQSDKGVLRASGSLLSIEG